jgi:hypothetical protein
MRRQAETLTCEVDATSEQTFEVCVVPHRNVSEAVIERFQSPVDALKRHAEVAMHLRETGWSVTDRIAA